jgi:outer membrane protein assembly factor BamB
VKLPADFVDTEESIIGGVQAGIVGADRDHLVVEVNDTDQEPVSFGFGTTSHAVSWTTSGFEPAGLAGDAVVGMAVTGAFSDSGTPEGLNAQTGEVLWGDSSLVASTEGESGPPAVVSPSLATFESEGPFSDTTYLLSTSDGAVRKTLPDSYTCMYDQVSVVACYAGDINGASLIGFDATSLKQLWALPDPAGTRVAPELHAAYKGLLYTAADNDDVILNALTGADEQVVPIAPDLVVPGYGLVRDDSDGDNELLAYPATS